MVYGWSLPVYRETVWLEELTNQGCIWAQCKVMEVTSKIETLMHWLDDSHFDCVITFTVLIGISLGWILCSFISSWKTHRSAATQGIITEPSEAYVEAPAFAPSLTSQSTISITTPPPKTPIKHEHATTTHADKTPPNDSPSNIGKHHPFGIGKRINDRTGRISTPGYQTPFLNGSSSRNFSYLRKNAPLSYDMLQRNGFLDEEGTPTKKYRSTVRREAAQAGDEVESVYDSPTKSWGNRRRRASVTVQ